MNLTPFDRGILDHGEGKGFNKNPYPIASVQYAEWQAGWAKAEGLRRAKSYSPEHASAMVIPPGPIEQKKLVVHAAELSEMARDLCFAAVTPDKVATPVKLGNVLVGLEKIVKSLQAIHNPPLMSEVDLDAPPAVVTEPKMKEENPE